MNLRRFAPFTKNEAEMAESEIIHLLQIYAVASKSKIYFSNDSTREHKYLYGIAGDSSIKWFKTTYFH